MKVTNLFTQADREVFDRIDRDCLAMHVVPPPKTFLKLEVRDGDGVLTDVYEDRAHSWVRNAYNGLAQLFMAVNMSGAYGAGSMITKDYSGSAGTALIFSKIDAGGSGTDTSGIVLSGNDALFTFDDAAFTRITSGSSAGQLLYNAGSFSPSTYDAATKKWTGTLTRVFNNNSGGPIVVKSVHILKSAVMWCRDVLAEAKTVPNAGQLTVTYTIEMTFPA